MEQVVFRQELVLVGGGHANLQLLRRLALRPLKGLRVTLISRDLETPYSAMLPGYVAGHYLWEDVCVDLVPLCAYAGVNFIHAEATGLDLSNRRVQIAGRPDIFYNLLSINVGSSYNSLVNKNKNIGISVRPLDGFVPQVALMVGRLKRQEAVDMTIVGGGPAGVEIALALAYRLHQEAPRQRRRLRLLTAEPHCLHEHRLSVRQKIQKVLRKARIEVLVDFKIKTVQADRLYAEDGRDQPVQDIIWASGAHAQPWVAESGLAVDRSGFVLVDEYLNCVGLPNIFAAGDIVTMAHAPNIPKAGVYAVRQGAILSRNIYRALLGQPPLKYKPQKSFLSLIALGGKSAIATRAHLSLQGGFMWHLKNWIDRRFVEKFRLKMRPKALIRSAHEAATVLLSSRRRASERMPIMRCGGCGSKLGADLLERTFERLQLPTDSISGIGDDAAVTKLHGQDAIVQTLDGFRMMLPDAYLMGRIAAIHALNDIYAMGAEPLNVLANIVVPSASDEIMEEQLFQTLAGALSVFEQTGVRLVGGHSSEGAELFVGFAVTGLKGESLWSKAMLRPNDQLILTRPIGAGVLLAAHMRGLCNGRWWSALIATLSQTNHEAWTILSQYDLGGCTDVSGFGLLRHALEMARASQCHLTLDAYSVPVLFGSLAAYGRGVESSLQQSNEQTLKQASLGTLRSADLRVRVLADPMTAGGFLASLPKAEVAPCLAALQAAGYRAAHIGEVLPTQTGQLPIRLVAHSGQ